MADVDKEARVAFEPEDVRRDRIRAEQRALRGTPERQQQIAELEEQQRAVAEAKAKARSTAGPSGKKTPENSTSMHGHPWAEWFAMRDAALELIIEAAKERRLTNYEDLWAGIGQKLDLKLGRPWLPLPRLLEAVHLKAIEDELGFIPTALVVARGDDQGPGVGFFRLAGELGLLAEADNPTEGAGWTMSDTQREFWQSQVEATYDRLATT